MSSPMRTTSQVLANSSAVCTIKTSASLAFIVVQPFSQRLVLNMLRKDRLLSVLDRILLFWFYMACFH